MSDNVIKLSKITVLVTDDEDIRHAADNGDPQFADHRVLSHPEYETLSARARQAGISFNTLIARGVNMYLARDR